MVNSFGNIDSLIAADLEEFTSIDEIGNRIAESLIEFFSINENLSLIDRLKHHGLKFQSDIDKNQGDLALMGKKFVISGVFESLSREELKNKIEFNGGFVMSSISKKQTMYWLGMVWDQLRKLRQKSWV